MTNPTITHSTPPRAGEDPSEPTSDQSELSHRSLLIEEGDREALPKPETFAREVRIQKRTHGRQPSWPTDLMA